MNGAGNKALQNVIEAVRDIAKKMKIPRTEPLLLEVPDAYVEYAADLYRYQDVIIRSINGAIYRHGEQIKPPGTSIDVTRLNERIAAMELPNYLRTISQRGYELHALGQFWPEEKGD